MTAVRPDPHTTRGPSQRSSRRTSGSPVAPPAEGAARRLPADVAPAAVRVVGRRSPWPTVLLAAAAVLLVVIPAVLAGYRSAQQPPTYAAVADLVYTSTQASNSEAVEREMATQQLLLVDRAARETAGQAVGRTAQEVDEAVSTEVVEGSDVLRVRVEDRSARVARLLAESLVTQYTAEVTARAAARMEEQRAGVAAQIAALDSRLVAIADRIGVISPGGEFAPPALQAEQRALESEAGVLREQVAALQQDSFRWSVENPGAGMPTAEVLAPAAALEDPVGPQPLRAAAAGALLGMLLAFLLLAFTRVRRSPDPPEAAAARP